MTAVFDSSTELADLRRAVIELREWQEAVLGCCKACDGFDAMQWGGDKSGWGFMMFFIGHLNTRALHAEGILEMQDAGGVSQGRQENRENIAKAIAYDLEEGAAHGARVATTPHLDNYHINGHVNLLALADAVLLAVDAPQPASNAVSSAWEPADFWKFVSGLAGEFEADQMRDMLAQRGLQIVGISDLAYTAWQPFDNAPRDGSKFEAWHSIWKCPVTIKYLDSGKFACDWVEATLATRWPDAAFTHWRPASAGPLVSSTQCCPLSGKPCDCIVPCSPPSTDGK